MLPIYSSIYARRSFGNVEFTPYVARSKIHKCFIVYFLLIFNLKPFQKQTPFRTLDLIRFIFLLAFLRFVFKFSEFHSHSLRDRPRGELTIDINGQCTCWGLKPESIKFLAPLPGKCFCTNLAREAKNLSCQVFGAAVGEWRSFESLEQIK